MRRSSCSSISACHSNQREGDLRTNSDLYKSMAVLPSFLVLFAFHLEHFKAEAIQSTLTSSDASFCHGGLEAIYPESDIDKCLMIPKDHNFRQKISTVWKAPQIYFSGAEKGSSLKKGEIQGMTLTDYHPPTPPQKTGFHRYQFMLFEQPPHTEISLTEKESSRGKWDFQAFIRRFNLGEPVAALQFLTQNSKD